MNSQRWRVWGTVTFYVVLYWLLYALHLSEPTESGTAEVPWGQVQTLHASGVMLPSQ